MSTLRNLELAWLKRADNPLTQRFLNVERRRARRLRRKRAVDVVQLAFIVLVFVYIVYFLPEAIFLKSRAFTAVPMFINYVIVPTYLVALAQVLFGVLVRCFHLLAATGQSTGYLQLDEAICNTPLTEEEILVGSLGTILQPLWRLILAGSIIAWLVTVTQSMFVLPQYYNVWFRPCEYSLLTIASLTLTGILGGTAIALLAFVLGRHCVSSAIASAAAICFTIAQLLWIAAAAAVIADEGRWIWCSLRGFAAAGPLLAFALLGALLFVGNRVREIQRVLPFLISLAAILMEGATLLTSRPVGFRSDLQISIPWSWGALAVLNPLAIPSPTYIGFDRVFPFEVWRQLARFDVIRLLFLLLIQLLLVLGLLFAAKWQLRKHRQSS